MRLEALLAAHARQRPRHTALVCGAERLSYAGLQLAVHRAATELHRQGVRAGDRVLLRLPNGVGFVQWLYAAFTLGAIAVPLNPRLAPAEVAHIAADAAPSMVIDKGLPVAEADALPTPPAHGDDCLLMYTSGTTGRPKGAVITHANMVAQNVTMHGAAWGIGAEDRFLVLTPLAHRAGIARLFNALGLGGTLVILPEFDPARALEAIEREAVSLAALAPTVIRLLLPMLRANPASCASLRRIVISTEACPVALKEELRALIPHAQIHSVYGMTEALVTNLDHAGQFSHPASVGRPFPGVEVRVVDADGRNCAPGSVGEILVRSGAPGSGAVFREYFGQPEASAAALRGGWFHTGDLGTLDDDANLSIVDRLKDMVVSGGYNIYSKEVEQALCSHPDIADAAVIGVPDELYGESVAACVEPKPGARLDATQVIEHCRSLLAGYKKPKHVFFLDALPRNSTGKVLKGELRELAQRFTCGHGVG